MKTALFILGNYVGVTNQELAVNDVIRWNDKMDPLVVRDIKEPQSQLFWEEGPEQTVVIDWEVGWDKVAYLTYNAEAAKKFTRKKTSQKREKEFATSIGGRTTPGSGAFGFHKGDVKSKRFLGEHKFTDGLKYSLSWSIWSKARKEAREVDKLPLMEVVLDQSNRKCMKIRIMEVMDFLDETNSTEAQLVNTFFFKLFEPRKGANSISLEKDVLEKHFNEVTENVPLHFPAFFLKFKEATLIGMEASVFDKIFE